MTQDHFKLEDFEVIKHLDDYGRGIADARRNAFQEILSLIDHDRDNGNLETDIPHKGHKGFSPALCLSKIVRLCEEEINRQGLDDINNGSVYSKEAALKTAFGDDKE